MAKATKSAETQDIPVETKLKRLYNLQCVDSKIDALLVLRGELPLEVKDLEKDTKDICNQQNNCDGEIKEVEALIGQEKEKIQTSNTLIGKYKAQIDEVRNNREHESLSKEIEFQMLEIELSEKKIRGYNAAIEHKQRLKEELNVKFTEKQKLLEDKQNALDEIVNETQKEIDDLQSEANVFRKGIEESLLFSYDRLRNNTRNGLAVVLVQRGACGGCFYKVPLQRQVDIKLNKKVAVCEYCGRFLVSEDIINGE